MDELKGFIDAKRSTDANQEFVGQVPRMFLPLITLLPHSKKVLL